MKITPALLFAIVISLSFSLFTFAQSCDPAAGWCPPGSSAPSASPFGVPLHTGSGAQNKAGDLFLDQGLSVGNGLSLMGGSFGVGFPIFKFILNPANLAPAWGKVLMATSTSGEAVWVATSTLGLDGGGSGGSSQWTTSGSNIYYNTGNVGVGLTSPSVRLDVGGIIRSSSGVRTNDGTVTAPGYSFSLDLNTGIFRPGNDIIALVTNSLERLRVNSAGDVGIGTTAPGAKLEVAGQVKITGGAPAAGRVLTSDATGLASWADPASGGGSSQWTTSGSNIYYNTGNVGVGNTTPFNYHSRGDGGLEIARDGRPELVLNRTTAGSQAAASLNISTAKDFVVNLKDGASPSIDALSISPATGNVTFAGSRISVGANNPFSYLQKGDKGIGVSSDRPEIVIANNTTARGASLNLNSIGDFVITTKYGANQSVDKLRFEERGNFIFMPTTGQTGATNPCNASREGALFINKAPSGTSTICACLSDDGTTFVWRQLATGGSVGTCPN